MKQIEIHIVERTSKKKFKNVEVYKLRDFHAKIAEAVCININDIGFLGRLKRNFNSMMQRKIAGWFVDEFEKRLKENRNR